MGLAVKTREKFQPTAPQTALARTWREMLRLATSLHSTPSVNSVGVPPRAVQLVATSRCLARSSGVTTVAEAVLVPIAAVAAATQRASPIFLMGTPLTGVDGPGKRPYRFRGARGKRGAGEAPRSATRLLDGLDRWRAVELADVAARERDGQRLGVRADKRDVPADRTADRSRQDLAREVQVGHVLAVDAQVEQRGRTAQRLAVDGDEPLLREIERAGGCRRRRARAERRGGGDHAEGEPNLPHGTPSGGGGTGPGRRTYRCR